MMSELSLNVLDIVQNSIKAGAKLIEVDVVIDVCKDSLVIKIIDDGCGMSEKQLASVTDPFFTTRVTRSVGLGVSFFKLAAEMTGGSFEIDSKEGQGTNVVARFVITSIDRLPLGDMSSTVVTLITCNPDLDFLYRYSVDGEGFTLSTTELREQLGDIPLSTPDVANFIQEFLKENTYEFNKLLKGVNI